MYNAVQVYIHQIVTIILKLNWSLTINVIDAILNSIQ